MSMARKPDIRPNRAFQLAISGLGMANGKEASTKSERNTDSFSPEKEKDKLAVDERLTEESDSKNRARKRRRGGDNRDETMEKDGDIQVAETKTPISEEEVEDSGVHAATSFNMETISILKDLLGVLQDNSNLKEAGKLATKLLHQKLPNEDGVLTLNEDLCTIMSNPNYRKDIYSAMALYAESNSIHPLENIVTLKAFLREHRSLVKTQPTEDFLTAIYVFETEATILDRPLVKLFIKNAQDQKAASLKKYNEALNELSAAVSFLANHIEDVKKGF